MTTSSRATNSTPASSEQLKSLVGDVLAEAKRQGASSAEASVSVNQGLSVTVRLGEVETVEHNRDKGLALTLFFGKQSGSPPPPAPLAAGGGGLRRAGRA